MKNPQENPVRCEVDTTGVEPREIEEPVINPKGEKTPFLVPEDEMEIEGGTGFAGATSSMEQ
eukprot:2655288-Prorocentrum_lima.AAC.1